MHNELLDFRVSVSTVLRLSWNAAALVTLYLVLGWELSHVDSYASSFSLLLLLSPYSTVLTSTFFHAFQQTLSKVFVLQFLRSFLLKPWDELDERLTLCPGQPRPEMGTKTRNRWSRNKYFKFLLGSVHLFPVIRPLIYCHLNPGVCLHRAPTTQNPVVLW